MKLRFNLAFDDNPWPGPLSEREAVWGEAWVGPQGLLGILETQLGLGGRWPSSDERDVALIKAVRTSRGFWARSAELDPFATARTLRRWRDHFVLWGWQPERADGRRRDRVSSLARVTRQLLPGIPDRLREVTAEVAAGRLDLEEVRLLAQPRRALPALWARLLQALEDVGVAVVDEEPAAAAQDAQDRRTDLARCFDSKHRPRPDGTLQLLRPSGPQAAAEGVAVRLAELAERDRLAGTVVIGSDALLDTALQARGVPTTGGPSAADGDPLLALLPLTIQLGWGPTDPQAALDLLLLPELPLPPGLASRLAEALCELPAVGSRDWERSRARYLDRCDEATRERLQGWLDRLFGVDAAGENYPAAAIQARIGALETWARGRAAGDEHGRFEALVASCVLSRRKLEQSGLASLTEPQLTRLLGETVETAGERWHAQAGLHRIASPEALVGPAERVIWWRFTRDAVSPPRPPLLSAGERALLETQGAALPEPGEQARWLRSGWLRPFALTQGELCLVTPRVESAGEPAYPHPVWDEVVARLGTRRAARLERNTPGGVVSDREQAPLPLPRPAAVWQPELAAPLESPKRLSPSRMGSLLGCPVRYVLENDVGLEAALPAALPTDPLLSGRYAHRLFEALLGDLVGQPLPEPDTLGRMAGEVFDREAPRLVAAWFRPGQERARAAHRAGFVQAAEALSRSVGAGRARITAVEQKLERPSRAYRITGIADLVLGTPAAIIDYKWWGKGRHRSALQNGTAYQLAAYAWAATTGRTALPAVGYFFIQSPELLTSSETTFARATVTAGPSAEQTMAALRQAVAEALAERARGQISCGGTPEDPDDRVEADHVDEDGRLCLAPPCGFCDLTALCAEAGVR